MFSPEQIRRLEHVADGKPIPKDENHIRAWDRLLTIDVPQDPRGTFKKKETAEIWKLVAHVRRHSPSASERVLAAGIEACIEELVKLTTKPIEPEPQIKLYPSPPTPRGNPQEGYLSLREALGLCDEDEDEDW